MAGESIALLVAVSWTLCALFFEYAGRRIGSVNLNLIRLLFAFFLLGGVLWRMSGSFVPERADAATWGWMGLSGIVGFVLGDYFLFYSYTLITARYAQLIMTLAPLFAALSGWMLLGEELTVSAVAGMCITLAGIALSIFGKAGTDVRSGSSGSERKMHSELPLKGILFALIGALGQGVGIVLSKVGMLSYESSLLAGSADFFPEYERALSENVFYVPFAATQMRILTGIAVYSVLIACTSGLGRFFGSFRDAKGMRAAFLGSVFGPFLGVALSLMAVRYANSAVASTIMATVPILILLPDKIFFGRKVTGRQIAGAVMSVAGVALFFV